MAKTRESGMPDETMWDSFFSPDQTLVKLGLASIDGDVVDFGYGYGTFAVPMARMVNTPGSGLIGSTHDAATIVQSAPASRDIQPSMRHF